MSPKSGAKRPVGPDLVTKFCDISSHSFIIQSYPYFLKLWIKNEKCYFCQNGKRKVTVGKFKSAWHILDFNRIKISFLAFVQNSKCTNVTSHDTARLSISASLPAPPPPKIWYNILPILNQNGVFIEINTQNMAIYALRRWLRCVLVWGWEKWIRGLGLERENMK